MENNQIDPEERRRILMQEWASALQYWATDNTILWQRCSVFLLVNSILFAPLALSSNPAFISASILKYGVPILAVFVNVLWLLVTTRSVAITRHFEKRAGEIRTQIPLLRLGNKEDLEKQFHFWWERVSGRSLVLPFLPIMFFLFWFAILVKAF